jgi:prolipoprotein diacylglyceryltransferase
VLEDALYAVATPAVIGGIIGARLFHVVECWTVCGSGLQPGYSAHPELIPQIWNGGISIMGALVVGVLTGYLIAIRRGDIPIGAAADAAAPGIGLGMAIGRIGDVINGEHHAIPCAFPGICVGYDNPDTLGQPGPVHLAVGYELLWDIAGVALALLLRRALADRRPEGRIFWIWLAFQSLGRLLTSFLRVDQPGLFGLYQAQLISIVLISLAIPMILSLTRMARMARATTA